MKPTISIVIPAYNEAANIPVVFGRIAEIFASLPQYDFEVIFVDDGSADDTQIVLKNLSERHLQAKYLLLSRNFGTQLAIKAGVDHAQGQAVISMDCDLQHPPELIPELLQKWENGVQIVYTLRTYPPEISFFKSCSSDLYYKLLNAVSYVNIEKGSSDFLLMDAVVVDVFKQMDDNEPFLRGMSKWVGFRQESVHFTAGIRHSGESKYSFTKLLQLGIAGVTSFSVKPLQIAIYLGFFFSGASILYVPYVLYSFINGTEVSGWASLIMTVVFFGGLQLSILGIIGVYIGKIFLQTKKRPSYLINEKNI